MSGENSDDFSGVNLAKLEETGKAKYQSRTAISIFMENGSSCIANNKLRDKNSDVIDGTNGCVVDMDSVNAPKNGNQSSHLKIRYNPSRG